MLASIRRCLNLLDSSGRIRLSLIVMVQGLLALLDLVAVVGVGVVVAVASSGGGSTQSQMALVPEQAMAIVARVGLIQLLVFVGLLFIAKSVISFILMRRAYRFLAGRQVQVSNWLAGAILSRNLLDIRKRTTQETSYALTQGVSAAMIGVLGNGVVVISELLVMLVLVGGLFVINPFVSIFIILFFGIVAVAVFRMVGIWGHESGSLLAQTEVESTEAVQNLLHTYREHSVLGRRPEFMSRFVGLRLVAAHHQSNMQILGQVTKYIFELTMIVGTGLLGAFLLLTESTEIAIATLVMFLAATSRVTPSLLRMQQAALSMRAAEGMAEPTLAFASEINLSPHKVRHPAGLRSRDTAFEVGKAFEPSLRLKNVSFSYPGSTRSALSEASLFVPAGTSLAIVGPSGAGKSTLADVLLGLLAPDSGSVLLGGRPPELVLATSPGLIGYVPQDVYLVRGTVRENIGLGLSSENIDDVAVWEALRLAELEEIISAAPRGLDTEVGERGVRLSGGQRQRLGLARALYSKPNLLVLDEATSALDSETEAAVTRALQHLSRDVTRIVIAHRLATVRDCDQVAYLEEGKILAVSTFQEVRDLIPRFDSQAGLLGL